MIKVKIFVCADLHGNKNIMNKIPQVAEKVDGIFICGDIGGKGIGGKTFEEFSSYQKTSATYLSDVLSQLTIPSRFVLGNDDWYEYKGKHYLKQAEDILGYNFVPFEYVSITPFNTNREVNENKMTYELNKLKVNNATIIVGHGPPYGAGDKLFSGERCGSPSILKWIEKHQPLLWLNGHIHEDPSVHTIGKTTVINCACDYMSNELKGYIVDLTSLEIDRIII